MEVILLAKVIARVPSAASALLRVPPTSPIVAFRWWFVRRARLEPLGGGGQLDTPIEHAHSHRTRSGFTGALVKRPHPEPDIDCNCGIWTKADPISVLGNIRWENAAIAVGVVAIWGKVIVQPGLVRAQHSRIAALASPPRKYHSRRYGVRCVARHLGVAAVPFKGLERAAKDHGEPFPAGLHLTCRDSRRIEDLDYRETPTTPAFRFLFKSTRGVVEPWSDWSAEMPSRRIFDDPQAVAVGDVFALDDDNAVAIFERVPSRWRRTAEHELRAWAEEDDWRLAIMPGHQPLASPPPTHEIPSGCFRCSTCGDTRWLNWISGPRAFARGYISSRCEKCDGRKRFVHPRKR